jgi:hypothetical protein
MLESEKLFKLSKVIERIENELDQTENKIQKKKLEDILNSVKNNTDRIEDILFKHEVRS